MFRLRTLCGAAWPRPCSRPTSVVRGPTDGSSLAKAVGLAPLVGSRIRRAGVSRAGEFECGRLCGRHGQICATAAPQEGRQGRRCAARLREQRRRRAADASRRDGARCGRGCACGLRVRHGAIQYCHWLYLKTGIFYRLPTEAEWEYAAKAGTETKYFFGDDKSMLSEYAWTKENSNEETHKIGQKKPNPWGLYDIYGNVLEWTSDQYDPEFYQNSPAKNPVNPSLKLYPRIVRGGSFKTPAEEVSSSKRFISEAKWKQLDPQIPKSQWWFPEAPFIGLRLVRPLNPPSPEEINAYYNAEPIADY